MSHGSPTKVWFGDHWSEESTLQYKCRLVDQTGAPMAVADLTTLTLTLYDLKTENIINTVSGQDVLDTDRGSGPDGDGVFTCTLVPADMAIETATEKRERHVMLFEWTSPTGQAGSKEVYFWVLNQLKR